MSSEIDTHAECSVMCYNMVIMHVRTYNACKDVAMVCMDDRRVTMCGRTRIGVLYYIIMHNNSIICKPVSY